MTLSLLALPFLAITPAPAPSPLAQKAEAPPGMVMIKGGRTKLGNDLKDIEKMINAKPTAKNYIRPLDGTTPQITTPVAGFFMMRSEVTNEQYMEFVKATGARPPHYWAAEAVDGARREFLSNKDRDKSVKFDPAAWWDSNWREHEWDAPKGIDLLRPVTFVNFRDAQAYCAWAGLRLPTEHEFQRACRGDGEALYPWGDEWEDGKYAATNEIRAISTVSPAGSFPEGANKQGVLDLSGNVWEWTTSPYSPYKGWKSGNEYSVGKGRSAEKLTPDSNWDPALKVVMGGSYVNDQIAAMCTIRRATDPTQQTQGVGFRGVASMVAGSDLAASIYQNTLRNSQARGEGVLFTLNGGKALDLWETRPSACSEADIKAYLKKNKRVKEYEAPEGFQVVTGYEHIAFVPREELIESGSDVQFERQTLREAQQLGFLSISEPMLEPTLAEGVYLLAYRAKGKFIASEAAEGSGDQEPEAAETGDPYEGLIDLKKNNLLILDAKSGEMVAHVELEAGLSIKKGKGGTTFEKVEEKVWVKDAEGEDVQVTENWLQLNSEIPTSQGRRYLPITLKMKPSSGFFEKSWRW